MNQGRMRWFAGDVVTSGGAALVDAGFVWLEKREGHTARLLSEPQGGGSGREELLTSWEDNDAAIHQGLGGYA